jgi:hypothetical protein
LLSFVHVWWADNGAIWLSISTARGLAFHGEAAKYKEKQFFFCILLTNHYIKSSGAIWTLESDQQGDSIGIGIEEVDPGT